MRSNLLLFGTALLVGTAARGQFGPEHVIHQPAANAPTCLVMADVDGNGYADAVSFSENDGRIAWFANDGAGQCGPRRDVARVAGVTRMRAADLDGDGDLDLLTARQQVHTIAWYGNDGQGNFGPPHTIIDTALYVDDIHAADVDEDGDLDVLSASVTDRELAWHANTGNGSFGAQAVLLGDPYMPALVTVADLDGDGHPDVCATTGTDLLWLRNAGGGVVSDTNNIPAMSIGLDELVVTDLDGDDDLDVAGISSCQSTLVWYPNDGSGHFPTETAILSGMVFSCAGHGAIAAGDLDGDGDDDLLISTSKLNYTGPDYMPRMVFNNGGGNFSYSAFPLYYDEEYTTGLWVGQLNNDAAMEVVVALKDNAILSFTHTGPTQFDELQQISGSSGHVMLVRMGDMNGDGLQDVVFGTTTDNDVDDTVSGEYGTVYWQAGDGNGNFGAPVAIGGGEDELRALELADAEGDGDLDVFYTYEQMQPVYWGENDGSGGIVEHVVAGSLLNLSLGVGDLDLDGDMDLVVPHYSPSELRWVPYDAGGFSTNHTVLTATVGQQYHTHLVDLDGDADLDVVYGGALQRIMNNGGVFGAPISLAPISSGMNDVCFADVDGDGDMDLVQGGANWYANDGTGSFGTAQAIGGASNDEISMADVNNDGRPDILFAKSWGPVGWYENVNGGQAWAYRLISTGVEDPWDVTGADFDNDGDTDVIVCSYDGSHVSLFENYLSSTYTITGRVFVDEDGNGVEDGNDVGAAFAPIGCVPTPAFEYSWPNGDYAIPTDAGQHVVSFDGAPLWTVTTDSLAYHIDLTEAAPTSTGNDFGIHAAVDSSDVVLAFTAGQGPCGQAIPLWVDITNAGTRREHGHVAVHVDELYTLLGTTPPADSTVDHTSYWNLDTLVPFEHMLLRLDVLKPDASFMGDTVHAHVTAYLQDALGNATGQTETNWEHVLACAYDPNYKSALPVGIGEQHIVYTPVPYVDHTIRFQNVGSAPAGDVTIADELSAYVDPSTLQVIGHSHVPTEVRIEADGTLLVRFQGIALPDSASDPLGSQGYFHFRVRPAAALPAVAPVMNTAGIIFDLNVPVITNTTLTTLVDCSAFSATITTGTDMLLASAGVSYQWYQDGDAIPGATEQLLLLNAPGAYAVEVVNAYGCHLLSEVTQVIALAVPEQRGTRMALVPDPMNDVGRVIFCEPVGPEARVELIDMNGRSLMSMRGNGSREILLERKGISSGAYVLRLSRTDAAPVSIRIVMD